MVVAKPSVEVATNGPGDVVGNTYKEGAARLGAGRRLGPSARSSSTILFGSPQGLYRLFVSGFSCPRVFIFALIW